MSKLLRTTSLSLAMVFSASAQAEPDHRAYACEVFNQMLHDSKRGLKNLLAGGDLNAGKHPEIYEDRDYNKWERFMMGVNDMTARGTTRLRHSYELHIEDAKRNIEELGCYEIIPMSSRQPEWQRNFG